MLNRLPCVRAARREREGLVVANGVLARQVTETQEEVKGLKEVQSAYNKTLLIINETAIRLEQRLERNEDKLEVEGGARKCAGEEKEVYPTRIAKEVPEIVPDVAEKPSVVVKEGKIANTEEFPRMEYETTVIEVSYNFVEVT